MKKSSQAAHRPSRRFPNADRAVFQPEIKKCPYCQCKLKSTGNISIDREVQTMDGPLNVRAYSWRCSGQNCPRSDVRYRARRQLWKVSLPKFGYGLDVVAYIGWQRDQNFRQFGEIQTDLHTRGIMISQRHVGRLYRQYLSLLGGLDQQRLQKLKEVNRIHGGVVWALDALQPDQDGTLLYVLYEAISETTVAAAWLDKRDSDHLIGWLQSYTKLELTVLATLSDGEKAEIKALKTLWSDSPHQMCLTHFLGDCIKPIKDADQKLKSTLRQAMGPLPPVPGDKNSAQAGPRAATPPFSHHKIVNLKDLSNENQPPSDGHSTPISSLPATIDQLSNCSISDNKPTDTGFANCRLADDQTNLHAADTPATGDQFIGTHRSGNGPIVSNFELATDILPNQSYQSMAANSYTALTDKALLYHSSQSENEKTRDGLASSVKINHCQSVCPDPRMGELVCSNSGQQESSNQSFTMHSYSGSTQLAEQITDLGCCNPHQDDLATASAGLELTVVLPGSPVKPVEPVKPASPVSPVSPIELVEPTSASTVRELEQIAESSQINQEQLRMREIEHLLRKSFQNTVRHPSRYPSTFGGLRGFRQLEGLVQGIAEQLPKKGDSYLHGLLRQGEQALKSAAQEAKQISEADQLRAELSRILFEPLDSNSTKLTSSESGGQQIKEKALELLLLSDFEDQSLTSSFIKNCCSLIAEWENSLFNCYDIPLLPANNAALESRFNRLRRASRRISGRQKTNELRRTAHLQLLLYAESEEELLQQFELVSKEAYLKARLSLQAAEERQRQLARLRRKPYETASILVAEYVKLGGVQQDQLT